MEQLQRGDKEKLTVVNGTLIVSNRTPKHAKRKGRGGAKVSRHIMAYLYDGRLCVVSGKHTVERAIKDRILDARTRYELESEYHDTLKCASSGASDECLICHHKDDDEDPMRRFKSGEYFKGFQNRDYYNLHDTMEKTFPKKELDSLEWYKRVIKEMKKRDLLP